MTSSRLKRLIITLAKIMLAVGLLGYLIGHAQDGYAELCDEPKRWSMLAAALAVLFVSVNITFVRWMMLVRALGLQFRFRDAMRLGYLGYSLNFVSLGSVGGDLFKAVFIAREQPGRRTEAVATIVIDRLVGLYALLMVAAGAILLGDLNTAAASDEIRVVSRLTLLLTGAGAIGIMLLLVPGFTGGRVSNALERIPVAGPTASRLVQAIRIYRSKFPTMLLALVMSVGVHLLLALSIYCISQGLPGAAPDLTGHFLAVPLAACVGAIPLTPSGLGAFEGSLEFLYLQLGAGAAQGRGTIVALCYRVMTLIIASVGVWFLIRGRRRVAEVLHETEEEMDHEPAGTAMEV